MSSAKGYQTVWFGVLPIPDLIPKNKEIGDSLQQLHEALNIVLIGIVVIHVVAALKHHFFDKDNVLKQMLPSKKQATTDENS